MASTRGKDGIYADKQDMIVDFAFDETVARVFPDMIRRSVPGYETIIPLLGLLAERYARPGTHIYDLGCSLGAATLAMRRRIRHDSCRIIAVDNAQAMLDTAQRNLALDDSPIPVEFVCADIRELEMRDASFVVMNFTLQFIAPADRLALLQKIATVLQPGDAFVLSEKLVFDDPCQQQLMEDLQLDFKRANGYSELEISQKRTALENVLVPDTLETHKARLHEAGFGRVHVWMQCFNFASLLAIK
ncbi:MAG: carboxy-S-adenosyl-L-methionine synthase CmoA [Granulosicoccaceae bacterium]|jgi:tRNA (cmo5U34)-methyltransferase